MSLGNRSPKGRQREARNLTRQGRLRAGSRCNGSFVPSGGDWIQDQSRRRSSPPHVGQALNFDSRLSPVPAVAHVGQRTVPQSSHLAQPSAPASASFPHSAHLSLSSTISLLSHPSKTIPIGSSRPPTPVQQLRHPTGGRMGCGERRV